MAFYLEKAIFVNRAPFEHLELDFMKNGINVLSAINGRGKTTILSHIVDAFYELARPYFENEFADKSTKYYRVSSSVFNIKMNLPSFVYLRFKIDSDIWDYVDIRNKCTENDYNSYISLNNKIPFSEISHILNINNNIKKWCKLAKKEKVLNVFSKNLLTYFPSYRYEEPGYLNDTYSFKIEHKIDTSFSGRLLNRIEVFCQLKELANWMLDVVLDNLQQTKKINDLLSKLQPFFSQSNGQELIINDVINKMSLSDAGYVNSIINDISYLQQTILKNINQVITYTLASKYPNTELMIGVGERNLGRTRINIFSANNPSNILYPCLFNMSSGEKALVSVFVELLHQIDNLRIQISNITGIVLIDEIDKNLHIKMQKEILPKLFNMFPNIQFIVSSHSPFLCMGLADEAKERTQIIDLDNNGVVCEPTNNDLYKEVYEMMITENQRFADRYNNLVKQIETNSKPIIVTEGKTDYRHIKKAINILGRDDVDVDFYQVPDKWGSSKLKEMLEQLSRIKQQKIVIGIFDRDEPEYLTYLDVDNQQYKTYGDSNVYAFAIPLVNESLYGNSISIEHYYNRNNLLKEDPVNHRRLFLGSEFHASGNSKDGNYQTKTSNIKHKVEVNGVIDDKVFVSTDLEQLHSVALTKDAFTTLIETNDEYINDFDFTNFNQILNVIQDIIKMPLH